MTMNRLYSLVLLVLFTYSSNLFAQQNKDIQFIEKYIEKARMDWQVPGLAVGIIKDGKVVMSKGFGTQEQGKSIPVDGNTLFAIASNTKAFISAALAMLVEEGKVAWDDPVQKHLPYFQLYDDYASKHTTVRDLLCHRVGLGTFSGDVIWYKSNYSAEETVRRASKVQQAYEYRAGYGYTNLMFITAGEVINAASGKTWDAYLSEKIFKPLKMDRTETSTDELLGINNVATPHKPVNGSNIPIAWANWDNMGAAGGIISSTNDMLKWLELQLDEGGKIFSAASQQEFWTMHNSRKVSTSAKKAYTGRHFSGYGLGWGLADYAGKMVVSHGGGYDGMYSRVVLVPEEELGIVVLTNSMKGISTALCNYIVDQYLGLPRKDWSKDFLKNEKKWTAERKTMLENIAIKRKKKLPASLSSSEYAGTYKCEMYGTIEVKVDGDNLQLIFPDAPHLNATLSHWQEDQFKIEWNETHAWFDFGIVAFKIDDNKTVEKIEFDVPNNDIFFNEINALKKD